jgi:hypothetical protein
MSKHHMSSHFQFLSEITGRSHEWLRFAMYAIDFSPLPPITDHFMKSIPQKSILTQTDTRLHERDRVTRYYSNIWEKITYL